MIHFRSRTVDQLAVVISADGNVRLAHQEIGCRRGLERSRHVIAKIDDYIGRALDEIRAHRLECPDVSVNVGENGDSHWSAEESAAEDFHHVEAADTGEFGAEFAVGAHFGGNVQDYGEIAG